jgi:hypothetical protein
MATAKQTQNVGDNIKATLEGKKLTLEIDTTKDFGPSKSGKTNVVASSRGNAQVGSDGVIIGVNIYRYLTAKGG